MVLLVKNRNKILTIEFTEEQRIDNRYLEGGIRSLPSFKIDDLVPVLLIIDM